MYKGQRLARGNVTYAPCQSVAVVAVSSKGRRLGLRTPPPGLSRSVRRRGTAATRRGQIPSAFCDTARARAQRAPPAAPPPRPSLATCTRLGVLHHQPLPRPARGARLAQHVARQAQSLLVEMNSHPASFFRSKQKNGWIATHPCQRRSPLAPGRNRSSGPYSQRTPGASLRFPCRPARPSRHPGLFLNEQQPPRTHAPT